MPGQQLQTNAQKPPAHSLKVILLVEGNNDAGTSYKRVIQSETPYHVLLTRDGESAWNTLHHIQADLLLITHQPPHVDGLQLYDRLQVLEGLTEVPAILLEGTSPIPSEEIGQRRLTLIKQKAGFPALIQEIERVLALPEVHLLSHTMQGQHFFLNPNERSF